MDEAASNYNADATFNTGSCEYLGCTDAEACNFDPIAVTDDGTCTYPEDLFFSTEYDCNGDCLTDTDGDGVCDAFEVLGCTDVMACNYFGATDDDGSCEYLTCAGCSDAAADNYEPGALIPNDDLCEYLGCTNAAADNFDAGANVDDGSCLFSGCTDPEADNYDPQANVDTNCIYLGCTNPAADNYDATANTNDGNCLFSGCTDPEADNYDPQANADSNCIYLGCLDPAASNMTPYHDDGSCAYLGGCRRLQL